MKSFSLETEAINEAQQDGRLASFESNPILAMQCLRKGEEQDTGTDTFDSDDTVPRIRLVQCDNNVRI
jgi:hypothetical protein